MGKGGRAKFNTLYHARSKLTDDDLPNLGLNQALRALPVSVGWPWFRVGVLAVGDVFGLGLCQSLWCGCKLSTSEFGPSKGKEPQTLISTLDV